MPLRSGGAVENEGLKGRTVQGLLTIGQAVTCPSGEQLTNGDFETGDFTGWTQSGDIVVDLGVPYEGSYFARCSICTDGIGEPREISQDLANQIPVECFGDTSIFQVACIGGYSESPPGGSIITITIVYHDDTETEVQWEAQGAGWELVNLKPYLQAEKRVKSIRINLTTVFVGVVGVDAVSCIP